MSVRPAKIRNRITDMLGVEYPIVQAPMGWIARAQLASAVSEAGGMGIIETSSGELDAIREEIRKMRQLTDKPFGVNIAHAFVRDETIIKFVIDQGVKFVTTSAGDPNRYCEALKSHGLTVFHVVPSLAAALKAIDARVDRLQRRDQRRHHVEHGQAVRLQRRAVAIGIAGRGGDELHPLIDHERDDIGIADTAFGMFHIS